MIKLLRQNNSQSNETSIHIAQIIRINFEVVFFADNFRECATLNAFNEEIFKLHLLLNQGSSIF